MLDRVERYLQLIRELGLKLIKAVDTHLHADHVGWAAAVIRHLAKRSDFEVFATLEDFPRGHTRYFLRKMKLAPAS